MNVYKIIDRGNCLGDFGVGVRIILKLILKKYDKSVDWICLAEDKDR
jgi:hypothetical protein